MLGIHDYWLFVATGIVLNLTPGQDTFYILGRSITQGTRAGVASALGITVGSFVHTAMAAVGLSALLATSGYAFTLVKLLGAAYLVYLGVRMLKSPSVAPGVARTTYAGSAPGACSSCWDCGSLSAASDAAVSLVLSPSIWNIRTPNRPAPRRVRSHGRRVVA